MLNCFTAGFQVGIFLWGIFIGIVAPIILLAIATFIGRKVISPIIHKFENNY